MPTLETLNEADLRGPLNTKSLRRARGYIHRVQDPARAGQTLTAQVRGSRLYQVEVKVDAGGIHAVCSCPYSWGGYCKHIGAVLLKWISSTDSFAVEEAASAAASGEYPIEVIPVEPLPTFRPEHLPFWMQDSFEERQRAGQQQLEKWLGSLKIAELRQMAKQRGWQVKGTRKADLARQIVDQIFEHEGIRQAILKLDREHQQVLRALALLVGEEGVVTEDLERVAGMWGTLKRYKQISTYTRHLWEAGLALPGRAKSRHAHQQAFTPLVIGRHLPPILEDVVPSSTDLQTDSAASGLRLADPGTLVRAANQVIMLLKQSPVPLRPPLPRPGLQRFYSELEEWDYDPVELAQVQKSGKLRSTSSLHLTVPPPAPSLPDEAIQRLAPMIGGETQLEFLYSLLVAAGIFQPGSPVTVWPEVHTRFLRQGEPLQRATLARTYWYMLNWSALWEVLRGTENLTLKRAWRHAYRKPEHLREALWRFRYQVLRVLACLPDDRWVSLTDLFQVMRSVWPRFDSAAWESYRSPSTMGAWHLARNDRPLRLDDDEDWNVAQGSFIRQVIAGPLHWLGLADLYFDGEELVAFRLHGLADLYWGRVEAPAAPRHTAVQAPTRPSGEAVTVDEHAISVNPSAVSAQAHSLLDKIARLDETTADRFVYRLDAQAAYEAFETGVALPELLADWERLLSAVMSDSIRDQLTAWWEAYGRVRIYKDLTTVEFGDDYALVEMKAVTSLEDYLIAEISPRLVIISRKAIAPLVAQLERAGYTPKQTDQV